MSAIRPYVSIQSYLIFPPRASASFSQDRSKFLIPNNQCGFDVYNIGTGTLYAPLRLDVDAANEDQFPATFLHSGEYVAGGGMGMVAIWHVASQKRLVTIPLTGMSPCFHVYARQLGNIM